MHVYGLQHNDPISSLLNEKLGELKYKAEPDTAKVVLAVAKDPNAIGFVDLSQFSPDERSVKLVDVYEGQGAGREGRGQDKSLSADSQALISIPLARTFTLYVSPNASQIAKEFADFAASPHCAEEACSAQSHSALARQPRQC